MAGPIPPYLDTQAVAQAAFSVPFGLTTLVNSSILAARGAGEFSVTVDCSLFQATDVSNLRVYLDSLGYKVDYAADSGQKGLLIDWGTAQPVTSGTTPVSVTIVPSATGVNLFSAGNIPSGTETILLTYTTTFPFHISQLIGWGNVDAEFLIYKNGTMVGGGWSSPSNRTLTILYEVAPISTMTGDIITVTVSQFFGSTQSFKVNLLGE